jgi:hypothetical protein
MWKQFFDLFKRVLMLAETTEANKAEIKKTERELKDFSVKTENEIRALWSAIERLAYENQHLKDQLQHSQKHEADEREKFMLRVENQLLKAGRQLPPAPDDDKDKG